MSFQISSGQAASTSVQEDGRQNGCYQLFCHRGDGPEVAAKSQARIGPFSLVVLHARVRLPSLLLGATSSWAKMQFWDLVEIDRKVGRQQFTFIDFVSKKIISRRNWHFFVRKHLS